MRTKNYRCKLESCRDKNPIDSEVITSWIHRFCSKKCRLSFERAKAKKEKEKGKLKAKKKRDKKANSITALKTKLWKIVSEYIRLRDSDDDNFCLCVTCPSWTSRRHYKDSIQAGHYIPSGSSSFHRYNEKNIHPQCYWCNCWKGWNLIEYRPFMIKKYWQEYTDWLYDTRNEITPLWVVEIKELIEQYQIKLNKVKEWKAID